MTQRINNLKKKFQAMAKNFKNDTDRTVSSTYEWGAELLELVGRPNTANENIILNNVFVTIRDAATNDEAWQDADACSTMMEEMRAAGVWVTTSAKLLPLPTTGNR